MDDIDQRAHDLQGEIVCDLGHRRPATYGEKRRWIEVVQQQGKPGTLLFTCGLREDHHACLMPARFVG